MRTPVVLAVLALASSLSAQSLRLNLTGGYVFRDRFPLYTTQGAVEATIVEAPVFGGGLEYLARENYGLELYYVGMPTEGRLRALGLRYAERVHVAYIMGGAVRYGVIGGRARAFGGASLGVASFDGETVHRAYAAWGLRGGAELAAADRVGIRVGAQLHSPIEAVGGGLYIGTGGSGGGVQTYSTIYQFGFFAALCVRLTSPPAAAGQ